MSYTHWMKMIIYGSPKIGKTTLLGTITDVPEMLPAVMLDVDGNTESIASRCQYLEMDDLLEDGWEEKISSTKINVVRGRTFDDLEKIMNWLFADGVGKIKTFMIDSYTELDAKELRQIVKTSGFKRFHPDVPVESDYGILLTKNLNCFYNLRDLDMHVIVTAFQFTEDKDDQIRPAMSGQARVRSQGIMKQVGILLSRNSERIIRFEPYGKYDAGETAEGKVLGTIENPTLRKVYDLRQKALEKANG